MTTKLSEKMQKTKKNARSTWEDSSAQAATKVNDNEAHMM